VVEKAFDVFSYTDVTSIYGIYEYLWAHELSKFEKFVSQDQGRFKVYSLM